MKPLSVISLATVLISLIFPVSSVAQWTRQSPLPTGNVLTDVCFINPDTGWIFGEHGTVFRTTDAGQSWTDQSVPSTGRINAGLFLDNGSGWVALSAGTDGNAGEIFGSDDWGNHWDLLFSDQSSAIRDISFLNKDTGWALGYLQQISPFTGSWNYFLKTENGGKDWLLLDFMVESHFTKLCFIDDTTGYIAGAGTPNLMKTSDGGHSWISVHQPTNSGLTDVVFTDLNSGYTCGNNFYFTHNGGASWSYIYCYYANSIGMYDDLNGWTVTMNKVFRIRDGGNALDYQLTADKSPLVGISAVDSLDAFIVGKDVTVYSTNNGGVSWQELSRGTNKPLYSVFFPDANTGWAGGADHTLLSTKDGGKHWIFNNLSVSSGPIKDIQFTDARNGWFVNGNVYYTIDSGATWNISQEPGSGVNDLYFIDNQFGWCAGSNGIIYKTNDGGMSWEDKISGTDLDLYAVFFNDEENGWVAGNGIIKKTADGGESWVSKYSSDESFTKIQFTDAETGFFLAGNRCLKTDAEGETWETITPEYIQEPGSLNDICFFNGNTGYISGNDFIMMTNDGGSNWTFIPGLPDIEINAIYFADINKGWIAGEDGAVFYTETGGFESVEDNLSKENTGRITVFPNPAGNILNFNFSVLNSGKDCLIMIYDVSGRNIYSEVSPSSEIEAGHSIDIYNFPPGIYFLVIKNDDKIQKYSKFIISR
jgi:photosystem II stability/assembly factor-like uncharacterized protein